MTTSPQQLYALAVEQHRAGNLQQAEQLCRELLAIDTNHPQLYYLLGLIASQSGRPAEAIAAWQRTVLLAPDQPDVRNNLGVLYLATKQPTPAAECFRQAIALNDAIAEYHSNLGLALQQKGLFADAAIAQRRAIALNPQSADAHYHLATSLKAAGDINGSIAAFRHALQINPRYVQARVDLGVALHEQGQLDEATQCQLNALAIDPNSFAAHNNLGTLYQERLQLDLALQHYHRAAELMPHAAEAFVNLGATYKWLGRIDEAWQAYQRAIAIQPNYAAAHQGSATVRLLRGDFDGGFAEFEWRWHTGQLPPRPFTQPLWNGSPLPANATLLLHCEQGFGDSIQFARYAAVIKNAHPHARVVLECEPQLKPLFRSLRGVDQLLARGESLPPFDVHAPLLSLPRILKTQLNTIPRHVPYLSADEALIEHWRTILAEVKGFRVGINWHGRRGHIVAERRDLPLSELAKLAHIPHVQLVNLQHGATRQELNEATSGPAQILHLGDEVDRTHGTFIDTTAILINLDLVITSDTALAHLAGALGVPVWLALPHAADWRWLLDRTDSPWYPTMRLFRQLLSRERPTGDWQPLFADLTAALTLAASQVRNR